MSELDRRRIVAAPRAEDTRAVGRRLGALAAPGTVFLLTGPLGAGKTTFVAGLGEGLGAAGRATSPTFVLVREHPPIAGGGPALVHVDLYRLAGAAEVIPLALDEFVDGGAVMAVEWADRGPVPEGLTTVRIDFQVAGEGRRLVMDASGPQAATLMAAATHAEAAGE